jgi:hypothetical protein
MDALNFVANAFDASYNWWGDFSGPAHTSNPSGSGDTVTGHVLLTPWLKTTQIEMAHGGFRLVELQAADGGWPWRPTDTTSSPNIFAPAVLGLLPAYVATGDSSMLAALNDAKGYFLAKTDNFEFLDGVMAVKLDLGLGTELFSAGSCSEHIKTAFYDALADGTYVHSDGNTYDTQSFVEDVVETKWSTLPIYYNARTWRTGLWLASAAAVGADTTEWLAGLETHLADMDESKRYRVDGLAGAIIGLNAVDIDPAEPFGVGDIGSAMTVADIAAYVADQQLADGSFPSGAGSTLPTVQDTAHAVWALYTQGGYRDEIAAAIDWLPSQQLATGGWTTVADTVDEKNNHTGEGLFALGLGNLLTLDATETSLFVQPSETVTFKMNVSNLLQNVVGCQAVLNFDSTYFSTADGDVSVGTASGSTWDELFYHLWDSEGDLDMSIGIDASSSTTGTHADASVATVALTPTDTEGKTRLVFRPDVSDIESTLLADMNADNVFPNKQDSVEVTIDGTGPDVTNLTATQDGNDVLACANTVIKGTVDVTVDASDSLAGLEGPPEIQVSGTSGTLTAVYVDDEGPEFGWTIDIDSTTPNGTYTIEITATDLAGNETTVSDTFCVNKNEITGQVQLEEFEGATRDVTFVATGGVSSKSWTLSLTFSSSDTTTYSLTEVPDGTTGLSAKTAWTLREKLTVTLTDGQASGVDFVGDTSSDWDDVTHHYLRGGDLNGTNSINILDYGVLKLNWFNSNAEADINGDGTVQTGDYLILVRNWFTTGDAE